MLPVAHDSHEYAGMHGAAINVDSSVFIPCTGGLELRLSELCAFDAVKTRSSSALTVRAQQQVQMQDQFVPHAMYHVGMFSCAELSTLQSMNGQAWSTKLEQRQHQTWTRKQYF